MALMSADDDHPPPSVDLGSKTKPVERGNFAETFPRVIWKVPKNIVPFSLSTQFRNGPKELVKKKSDAKKGAIVSKKARASTGQKSKSKLKKKERASTVPKAKTKAKSVPKTKKVMNSVPTSRSKKVKVMKKTKGTSTKKSDSTKATSQSNIPNPRKYKHINKNIYLCGKPAPPTEDDIHICACSKGGDLCGSGCVNRMLKIECNPDHCINKNKCTNQCFEKRLSPPLEVFYTGDRGFGIRCNRNLQAGEFVVEYCGEILDREQCKKRIDEMGERNETNFYLFKLDSRLTIDAAAKGNLARFLNHSCAPNCISEKWTVHNHTRVGIFTKTYIPKGTELTYNYNFVGFDASCCQKCYCGSSNCSGRLQAQPEKPVAEINPIKKKFKRKLPNELEFYKHHLNGPVKLETILNHQFTYPTDPHQTYAQSKRLYLGRNRFAGLNYLRSLALQYHPNLFEPEQDTEGDG